MRGGGITGMKSLSRTICAMLDCNLMNFKRVFALHVFFILYCGRVDIFSLFVCHVTMTNAFLAARF